MQDRLEALRLALKNALEQTQESNGPRPEEIAALFQEALSAHEAGAEPPSRIGAAHVRLLVTDEATGRLYLRVLPVGFLENHNGITLTGENIAAQEVKMVFLSADAAQRLAELQGSGPEKPRCKHD